MPSVIVQTAIPQEEYERFKNNAEKLQLSEYAWLQEIIIVSNNEPNTFQKKRLLTLLKEFFKKDIELTGT